MAITNNIGSLKIQITSIGFYPVKDASVFISKTGQPNDVSDEYKTDENGIVLVDDLEAPSRQYSMDASCFSATCDASDLGVEQDERMPSRAEYKKRSRMLTHQRDRNVGAAKAT